MMVDPRPPRRAREPGLDAPRIDRQIVLCSRGTEYAWDVGRVAGAFDARAALDYDRVAMSIVALHPYTTPPESPR